MGIRGCGGTMAASAYCGERGKSLANGCPCVSAYDAVDLGHITYQPMFLI